MSLDAALSSRSTSSFASADITSSFPYSEKDETEFNFAAFRWHRTENTLRRNPRLTLPVAAEALLDLGGTATAAASRSGSPQPLEAIDAGVLTSAKIARRERETGGPSAEPRNAVPYGNDNTGGGGRYVSGNFLTSGHDGEPDNVGTGGSSGDQLPLFDFDINAASSSSFSDSGGLAWLDQTSPANVTLSGTYGLDQLKWFDLDYNPVRQEQLNTALSETFPTVSNLNNWQGLFGRFREDTGYATGEQSDPLAWLVQPEG